MDEEVAAFQNAGVKVSEEDNKRSVHASAFLPLPLPPADSSFNRLKRMIDKHVLLVMLGTYFCQSLDKGTLSCESFSPHEGSRALLTPPHLLQSRPL